MKSYFKPSDVKGGSRKDNWRLPSDEYLALRPNYKNEADEAMVKEMAELVKDFEGSYTRDPAMLLRFIHARGNVKDAVAQWKSMMEFRKSVNADNLTEDDVPAMMRRQHYNASGRCMYSKEGNPVTWQHPAQEDYFGQVDGDPSLGFDNICKSLALYFDLLDCEFRDISVEKGKVIDKLCVVSDLAGLSLAVLLPYSIGMYKKQMAICERNFPERAYKVRIINPPGIFATAWDLVKDTFAEATQAKIKILRNSADLSEIMEADNIPEYLGGTKRIYGDPFCRFGTKGCQKFVKVPGNAAAAATADPDFMLSPVKLTINVAARGQYQDFRSVPAGTKLKWSFSLPAKDIDFTIKKFKDGGPLEGEVIRELSRASYTEEHSDILPAETVDCTYEFNFDNSFSYMSSKDVVFSFDKEAEC